MTTQYGSSASGSPRTRPSGAWSAGRRLHARRSRSVRALQPARIASHAALISSGLGQPGGTYGSSMWPSDCTNAAVRRSVRRRGLILDLFCQGVARGADEVREVPIVLGVGCGLVGLQLDGFDAHGDVLTFTLAGAFGRPSHFLGSLPHGGIVRKTARPDNGRAAHT